MRQQGRTDELIERALRFMQEFTQVMARRQGEGALRTHLRECWTLSACLALCSEIPWLGRKGCRRATLPRSCRLAAEMHAIHWHNVAPSDICYPFPSGGSNDSEGAVLLSSHILILTSLPKPFPNP